MDIHEYIGAGLGLVCLIIGLLAILNPKLPEWFCLKLGWHISPDKITLNGPSLNGCCPRCGKPVSKLADGRWKQTKEG